MAEEVKKAVCPECGAEAECFCRRITDGVLLTDEYILWCSTCEKQETKKEPAGHRIVDRDYPAKSVCPFCGRPPGEHRRSLSEGELIQLMHRREEKDDSLRTIEDLCEEPVAASIAPPPRARRTTVGTEKTAKPVTSHDITKLMAYFALLYAIVMGVSVFIARTSEGTPFTTALYVGLTTAGLVLVAMVFISVLIIRDFRRRFETSLRQKG